MAPKGPKMAPQWTQDGPRMALWSIRVRLILRIILIALMILMDLMRLKALMTLIDLMELISLILLIDLQARLILMKVTR